MTGMSISAEEDALVARLRALDTCAVSDALDHLHLSGATTGGDAPLPGAAAPGKFSAQACDQRSDGDASAGCGGGEAPQPAVPLSISAPACA